MKVRYLNIKPVYEWEDSDDMNINTIDDVLKNTDMTTSIINDSKKIIDDFRINFNKEWNKINSVSPYLFRFSNDLRYFFNDYVISDDDIYNILQGKKSITFNMPSELMSLIVSNGSRNTWIDTNRFLSKYVEILFALEYCLNNALKYFNSNLDKELNIVLNLDTTKFNSEVKEFIESSASPRPKYDKYDSIMVKCDEMQFDVLDKLDRFKIKSKNPVLIEIVNTICKNNILGVFNVLKKYTNLDKNLPISLIDLNYNFYKHIDINEFSIISNEFRKIKQISVSYPINISEGDNKFNLIVNATDVKNSLEAVSQLKDILNPNTISINVARNVRPSFKFIASDVSATDTCKEYIEQVAKLIYPNSELNINYNNNFINTDFNLLCDFYKEFKAIIKKDPSLKNVPDNFSAVMSLIFGNNTLLEFNIKIERQYY